MRIRRMRHASHQSGVVQVVSRHSASKASLKELLSVSLLYINTCSKIRNLIDTNYFRLFCLYWIRCDRFYGRGGTKTPSQYSTCDCHYARNRFHPVLWPIGCYDTHGTVLHHRSEHSTAQRFRVRELRLGHVSSECGRRGKLVNMVSLLTRSNFFLDDKLECFIVI